jgi:tetratricopeptide (TPR) repeat protein
MEELQNIIVRAKALKQKKELKDAISLLEKAHEIGVKYNAVEDLVDIHNQLILLYYQDTNPEKFSKSYNFARTLAVKINYSRGLVETYMNMAWVETDSENFIEAVTHATQALSIDDILENSSAFTTCLYVISEANFKIGDHKMGEKYQKLYQRKLMQLSDSEEQMLKKIPELGKGMTKEEDLDTRVRQALDELDSF